MGENDKSLDDLRRQRAKEKPKMMALLMAWMGSIV